MRVNISALEADQSIVEADTGVQLLWTIKFSTMWKHILSPKFLHSDFQCGDDVPGLK